jgi:hypothetical protein
MGVGVAGLQAIATARRLGAIVSATDVRPAVKEQVASLGAKTFIQSRTRSSSRPRPPAATPKNVRTSIQEEAGGADCREQFKQRGPRTMSNSKKTPGPFDSRTGGPCAPKAHLSSRRRSREPIRTALLDH